MNDGLCLMCGWLLFNFHLWQKAVSIFTKENKLLTLWERTLIMNAIFGPFWTPLPPCTHFDCNWPTPLGSMNAFSDPPLPDDHVGTHFGALWKFYWMSFLCVLSTTVSFSQRHFCQQHDHICACFTMLIRTFTLLLLWHGSSLRMQKSIAGSKCLNEYICHLKA